MPTSVTVPKPKAVLFDHDGVLVASEPLHWAAWEQLLSELGIPYNGAEMGLFVGKTAPEIMMLLLNRYKPGWNPSEYNLTALARRKNDIYLEAARRGLQPYPGVPEGLQWLRSQGIKTAVVSNAKRRELETALHQLGLTEYLDIIVSRDDVSAPKPDPTPYLFAAASLGLEGHECLAVEDSPTGLEAALVAKVPAAAVTTNFSRQNLEDPVPGRPDLHPLWVGESMEEFFEWLKGL
ncbi:HAD family phosphatase [Bdellovibrionota bacterium FG-1]